MEHRRKAEWCPQNKAVSQVCIEKEFRIMKLKKKIHAQMDT